MHFYIILFWLIFFCWTSAFAEQRNPLLIFAAASLKDALEEIVDQYELQTNEDVTVSLASSSILARQIHAGAPADVFISADNLWMDYVIENAQVYPESRRNVASNSLVVIGNLDFSQTINLDNSNSFLNALNDGRFSVGDPLHVPSGRYAKAAFKSLEIWNIIENKVIPTDNTRVALALVARNEVPLGVVYESDARSNSRVKILAKFNEDLHPTIEYSAVAIKTEERIRSQKFIEFLNTVESKEAFLNAGFQLIE